MSCLEASSWPSVYPSTLFTRLIHWAWQSVGFYCPKHQLNLSQISYTDGNMRVCCLLASVPYYTWPPNTGGLKVTQSSVAVSWSSSGNFVIKASVWSGWGSVTATFQNRKQRTKCLPKMFLAKSQVVLLVALVGLVHCGVNIRRIITVESERYS